MKTKKNEEMKKTSIETERLVIRNVLPEDARDCYDLDSDRETGLMLNSDWKEPYSFDHYAEGIEMYSHFRGKWPVIALKSENKVIGQFHVLMHGPRCNQVMRALALYEFCISPQYRRQGYGQECLEGIISHIFQETEYNLIVANVLEINQPALALLEKVGFVREGILHKAGYYPGLGVLDKVSLYLEKPGAF